MQDLRVNINSVGNNNAGPQNPVPLVVPNNPPVQNTQNTANKPAPNAAVPQTPAGGPANTAAVPASTKPKSSSPWDEELDEAENPKSKQPTIIGSLDPKTPPPATVTEKPAPLKLPENVEEKVGQKIPAANFINSEPGTLPQAISTAVPPIPNQPSAAVPSSPPPSSSPNPAVNPNQSTLLGKFFSKNKAPTSLPKTPVQNNSANIINDKTLPGPKDAITSKEVSSARQNSMFKKMLLAVPGLALLIAVLVGLTEMGLLSLGVEKIYGALQIEQIWGGLGSSTEKALARSAFEMQNHLSYKVEGTVDLTVDSTIKSDIVSPLLTIVLSSQLARDESVIFPIKAIQTAEVSPDDFYYPTNSNSNKNSNVNKNSSLNANINNNSNLNSNINSNANRNENSNQNLNTNSNANADINKNTNSSNGNIKYEGPSNIKKIEGNVNLLSSESAVEAAVKINDSKNSSLKLILDDDKLLVKSAGGISYGELDKWSEFQIPEIKNKALAREIFNLSTDSGFSIRGERSGNEKIGTVRCFKYRIDSLEIGSALSDIGITSDMIPTLSGEVWIGVKDKLIRKVSLKITTPVASATRMIETELTFKDFDVKNSFTKVNQSEKSTGKPKGTLTGDEKRKNDVNSILDALLLYKKENGSYPVSNDLLKLNSSDNIVSKALVPRFLPVLPIDPKSADGWYYAYKSDGTKCSVSSRLETQSDPEGQLINNVLLYLKYNNK